MKLKHIALAVLAATGFSAANAAIQTSLNNAEVFFVAYDAAGTNSFNFDTGVNVSSLIDGSINFTTSFAGNTTWNSFVTASGGLSNISWYVEALQNQTGTNTKFLYATLAAGEAVAAGTNSAFNAPFNNEVTSLNATTISAGQSEIAAAGTSNYLGTYDSFTPASVNKLSSAVGTTGVSFFGVANSNTSKPSSKQTIFATPTAVAGFTAAGTLTIAAPAVVPSVPEPESYGLALVGLLLAGAVARRRSA
jgi:MYXO-CTERM domain-containing protein